MFKNIDSEQRKALLLALGGVLLLLIGFAVFHKRALTAGPAPASATATDANTTGAPTTYQAAPTIYQTIYSNPQPSAPVPAPAMVSGDPSAGQLQYGGLFKDVNPPTINPKFFPGMTPGTGPDAWVVGPGGNLSIHPVSIARGY